MAKLNHKDTASIQTYGGTKMNQTIETMKSKGKWHPESELKWLSKASIEEVERR